MFEPIVHSRVMREIDRTLRVVAPKDVAVLLVGESGTGKDVFARRIHELSSRRAGPFVPLNCAAVPEALFESEVFGHEKGSFTGATERARGKIEAAHGGTLFLDEIGEMPLAAQAKLLRVLENRKFMRLGGSEKIAVDARLICATLRPLEGEVAEGRFRADLFYRIQGITLELPPLRARAADVRPLVEQFARQLASKHGTSPVHVTRAALAGLREYEWPGNVRELLNVVERLTVLRAGRTIRVRDLPERIRQALPAPSRGAPARSVEVSLDDALERSVGRIIDAALALEGGNRARTAARLGLSIRTIQRHLEHD